MARALDLAIGEWLEAPPFRGAGVLESSQPARREGRLVIGMSHPPSYRSAVSYEPEPLRIGGRLKNALIADLFHAEEDLEERDRLLIHGATNDDYVWTSHLGRQLGMRHTHGEGVHETLLVLLREIEALMTAGPVNADAHACGVLAALAVKDLDPDEVEAMLFAGGPTWMGQHISCRLDRLQDELKRVLCKVVASGLGGMLQRWADWDLRQMWKLREEAVDRETKAANAARDARRAGLSERQMTGAVNAEGKLIPPPPIRPTRKPDVPFGFQPPGRDWRPGYDR